MNWIRLAICGFFGIGLTASAEWRTINRIAAVVNDAVITGAEVENNAILSIDGARRQHWDKPARLNEAINKLMEESLDQLVERALILEEFKTAGFNLPEVAIEDEIRRRIHLRYGHGDRRSLTKDLQAQGKTFETYRQEVREDIVIYLMRQKNVSSAIVISPAKIERFYAARLTNYHVGDQVKLRVVVLNVPTPAMSGEVRKRAQEVQAKLQGGIPFAEMASVYSEGLERQKGGDWGWRDRNYLKRGLSDVAFLLNPGERSGILGEHRAADDTYWIYQYDSAGVMTLARHYSKEDELIEERKINPHVDAAKALKEPDDYYLLLVEDKRPAHVRPLTEVQQDIEKELLSKEVGRLQKKWVDRLREKNYVRFF